MEVHKGDSSCLCAACRGMFEESIQTIVGSLQILTGHAGEISRERMLTTDAIARIKNDLDLTIGGFAATIQCTSHVMGACLAADELRSWLEKTVRTIHNHHWSCLQSLEIQVEIEDKEQAVAGALSAANNQLVEFQRVLSNSIEELRNMD